LHGAAHDPPDVGGATHLLEHLTLRRCGRLDRAELARLVDRLGGDVDAWTCSEQMGVTVQTTVDALPEALALLSDAVLEPTFDAADVELEQRVARAELELVLEDPAEQVEQAILEAAWGDHPLSRPIIGSEQSLERLTPELLQAHHATLVRPGKVMAAVAGDVGTEEVAQRLARLPLGARPTQPPLPPVRWVGGRVQLLRSGADQVHARIAFPAPPVDDPAVPALTVLNRALGVGASSRLFQRLREDEGLTYDVWSGITLRTVGGLLEVGWACAPRAAAEVERLVREELEQVVGGLGDDEVEVAVEGLVRGLEMDAESPGGVCAMDVAEVLYKGRQFVLEQAMDELRSVQPREVRELAGQVLRRELMAVAVCGPKGTVERVA